MIADKQGGSWVNVSYGYQIYFAVTEDFIGFAHTQSFMITCRSKRLKPKFIPNLIKNQKSKPVDYTESTGFMLKILITK